MSDDLFNCVVCRCVYQVDDLSDRFSETVCVNCEPGLQGLPGEAPYDHHEEARIWLV